MSPREKGIELALVRPPLSPAQIETAARILASVDPEQEAA